MRTGFSPSAPTSIAPSIRHTTWRSSRERPQKSVPRIPAVTCDTRTLTSRFLPLPTSSVVKRNAPSSTCSVALNRSLPGCISANTRRPFSPSFTTLPSESFTCTRAPPPEKMRSPARSSMPGASGTRLPSRSSHAGICTPSTTAPDCCAMAGSVATARRKPSNNVFIEASVFLLLLYEIAARFGCDNPPLRQLIHNARSLRRKFRRTRSSGVLDQPEFFPHHRGGGEAEVLLPVHVPLPLGEAAHGPRAQLHHRRRAHALPPHARLQRAAADGLGRVRPARGKRGDGEPRAAGEVDLRQHRLHEVAAAEPRLRARLDARSRHLQAGLLQVEPVAVHAPVQEGHRVQEDRRGELGSGRPDGSRQRAGDRGPRLAHRRAGGEARDPDVFPAHHRIRRGTARRARQAARLARAGEADAEELDRQIRRRPDWL